MKLKLNGNGMTRNNKDKYKEKEKLERNLYFSFNDLIDLLSSYRVFVSCSFLKSNFVGPKCSLWQGQRQKDQCMYNWPNHQKRVGKKSMGIIQCLTFLDNPCYNNPWHWLLSDASIFDRRLHSNRLSYLHNCSLHIVNGQLN